LPDDSAETVARLVTFIGDRRRAAMITTDLEDATDTAALFVGKR